MSAASQPGVFHAAFGEKLKRAREALGLTPADVAAKLKLSERQIEALEAEDLTHLPGDVFARGFVRNYARLVEIDPEQLIVPVDIHAAAAETITAPSENVIFSSPGLRRWVLLPLVLLGFFVLLVALLYYWLRQGEDALVSQPVVPPAAMAVPAAPPAPLPATPQMLPHAGVPESVAPADTAPAIPDASPPAATPVPAPAPAAMPVPPAAPAAAPAGKIHTLRFDPALDAWIQVVDGQGKRYSKLVRAGSAETFSGEPPFRLVVGEAAQVQLSYDGHHIDLTPYIGQKVARLTLE
jgi:cytoskeleton protein RodZ